jgi:hypothetical protein
MSDLYSSIFRDEAVQHYLQGSEKTSVPCLTTPQTFLGLWVLLGVLLAGGFGAWFVQVPVYASGPAVLITWDGQPGALQGAMVVVALIPAQQRSSLRLGQTLILSDDASGEQLRLPIVALEPDPILAEAAQERFGLKGEAIPAFRQAAIVTIARLEQVPAASAHSYRADVEIGSRRILSLIPLIGRFLAD